MRRILRVALAVVLIAFAGALIGPRLLDHDPATWHVDPSEAGRPGTENGYLVAPAGATAAPPDRLMIPRATTPEGLLFQFDAIARNAPRTEVIAGSVAEGRLTYVQTSRFFGFPDYISVEAVETPAGTALVIWSRARLGRSDLGVNRDRIDGWLAQMGDRAE